MVIPLETSVENCFVHNTHMLKASENREVRKTLQHAHNGLNFWLRFLFEVKQGELWRGPLGSCLCKSLYTAGLPGMAHIILWPMDSHQAPYTYFIAYTGEYPISHIKILCSNLLCIWRYTKSIIALVPTRMQ